MSTNRRDGTPTPLANNEPPDLPPLTFDIDDVTGHYPIGLMQEKLKKGKFSENPLEHPDLFDEDDDDVATGPVLTTEPRRAFTVPSGSSMHPVVLLGASLVVGSLLAMLAVGLVLLVMAMLGV